MDDKPVIYDETYAEIIRKNLNLMARWQERELRKKCPETITVHRRAVPVASSARPSPRVSQADVIEWIDEVTSGLEGMKGIHCCANTDWPFVMSMDIDVLSFDAYDYGYTISLYPEEVEPFLKNGAEPRLGHRSQQRGDQFTQETATSLAAGREALSTLPGGARAWTRTCC